MFAIWAAECVVVPINYKLHPREMVQILDDAGVAQVFASPKIGADLASVTKVPIETVDSQAYSARLTGAPADRPRVTDPATLAWLFYTSGTTGRSKGAMLSHRNLMAMTVSHLADFDSPDQDCSLLHGAPMSHGSGLYIPPYVLRGARQVIPESAAFEPDEFLDLCEHHPGSQRLPCADDGAATRPDRTHSPTQPADSRLRRRADVRRQPEEGDGGVRPDLRPALRTGRGADDHHGTATGRPPRRRRRDPGIRRLRPLGGGCRGAARRRHTGRGR